MHHRPLLFACRAHRTAGDPSDYTPLQTGPDVATCISYQRAANIAPSILTHRTPDTLRFKPIDPYPISRNGPCHGERFQSGYRCMVSTNYHTLTEHDALAITTLEHKKELDRLSTVDSDDAINHLIAIGAPVNDATIAQASECILHARVQAQHHLIKLNDTRLESSVVLNSAKPRSIKAKRKRNADRYKNLYDRNIPCQFIMFDERRYNDVVDDIVDQILSERLWINNIRQRRRVAQISAGSQETSNWVLTTT